MCRQFRSMTATSSPPSDFRGRTFERCLGSPCKVGKLLGLQGLLSPSFLSASPHFPENAVECVQKSGPSERAQKSRGNRGSPETGRKPRPRLRRAEFWGGSAWTCAPLRCHAFTFVCFLPSPHPSLIFLPGSTFPDPFYLGALALPAAA